MTAYATIEDLNVSDALQHILRTDASARRVMHRWLTDLATNKSGRPPAHKRAPDINAILRARPRYSSRGAPMGAVNRDERDSNARVYCQRVRLVDGCYGPDGTYWGMGQGLWAVFTADLALLWYVRATTRAGAVVRYMQENPRAREYGRPKA